MKRFKPPPRMILLGSLTLAVALAFYSCVGGNPFSPWGRKPRLSMAELDAKAKPFVDEANAAIPHVASKLCKHRCRLYWLLLKDKCLSGNGCGRYIASVIEPDIVVPLRKAAAIYSCATNVDAMAGLPRETALDSLSRQLYAGAGLAIEGLFVRTTIESCMSVVCHCSPRLAASWGMAGACGAADGPLPIGDIVGAGLAICGTVWCCADISQAYRSLPREMERALRAAVSATVAQCRLEAASAL